MRKLATISSEVFSRKNVKKIPFALLWFHEMSCLFLFWRNSKTIVTQPFDGQKQIDSIWCYHHFYGQKYGHGTYGRTWDIRTDMGHSDGHGTYGRTWDIRTDMGHTDGHLLTKKSFY